MVKILTPMKGITFAESNVSKNERRNSLVLSLLRKLMNKANNLVNFYSISFDFNDCTSVLLKMSIF